jgi:hypothetical protein
VAVALSASDSAQEALLHWKSETDSDFRVIPALPAAIEALRPIAYNLRCTGAPSSQTCSTGRMEQPAKPQKPRWLFQGSRERWRLTKPSSLAQFCAHTPTNELRTANYGGLACCVRVLC